MAAIPYKRNMLNEVLIPLASAFFLVMFLFFIDEGYYDFRWMFQWGNWIAFMIYLVILFPIQWIIAHFGFGKYEGLKKSALMFGIGVPLTLLLFYWIVL
jgi:hypothetical protein